MDFDGSGVQRAELSGSWPAGGRSAGVRLLVPGWAQWSWRQRERALVLFGSFVLALAVGVFAWGSWTGTAVLVFAFGTHVVSVVDVVRQSAFPGFGRWMPTASAAGGLAVAVYAPTLLAASLVAWPVGGTDSSADGYVVNCRAYRTEGPRPGDWVWLRSSPWSELHVGRIAAVPGQEVEWSAGRLRVDGAPAALGWPFRSSQPPDDLAFTIPEGHYLVDPSPPTDAPRANGLILVGRDQIKGRAWAQLYPVGKRQLLGP